MMERARFRKETIDGIVDDFRNSLSWRSGEPLGSDLIHHLIEEVGRSVYRRHGIAPPYDGISIKRLAEYQRNREMIDEPDPVL